MIFEPKEYQSKAVDKIRKRIELLYEEKDKGNIVFKAPTGSGKTFMCAYLFEQLCSLHSDYDFCVMWACPGTGALHIQSFDAVKRYLGGNPKCSLLEDDFFGKRSYINNKEIVFVDWQKLILKDRESGKWANNLMKDSEGMSFFDVIQNTKKNGTRIILVVDESHIGKSQASRIKEFKETIIIPDIVLEMSATPISDRIDVEISPRDVVDEGMIKNDVIVNEGISKDDRSLEDQDSEQLILEKGFNKRLELKAAFERVGSNVNPLVLIQIPNVDAGEAKKEVIVEFLRDKGITIDSGKLKFWCDDHDKFDKKLIKNNTDITEFLVFKTAVATGWDCPRAHVLIKFRDGKSEIFETQTIGRILRTPEAKSYDDPLLDNAYIFTNVKDFETKQDTYNPNRIKTEFAVMKKPYDKESIWQATQLDSFYRSRKGDYNSTDSRFHAYFLKAFMDYFGFTEADKVAPKGSLQERFEAKGMDMGVSTKDELAVESHIDISTVDEAQSITNDSASVQMSENDIQARYYDIIRNNMNDIAYVRSHKNINQVIMDVFSMFFDVFPRNIKTRCFQKLCVKNSKIIGEVLSNATRAFRDLLESGAGKQGVHYDFKIDTSRAYSTETHMPIIAIKSLYQPLFVLKKEDAAEPRNNLEKKFIKFLDEENMVEWYWENGAELMRVNFGISYNNNMNTFQPDFIVKFKDGTVGIFDTKPIDFRVEDTKLKSDALRQYLANINSNRGYAPRVVGGIVVNPSDGDQFFLFDDIDYVDYKADHSRWHNFNDLLRDVQNRFDAKEYEKKHNN